MDSFYFSGVATAFIIGVVKVLISISALLSLRARNLKKIGLYYSCLSGTFNGSEFVAWKFLLYLAYMLLLTPLFSWITVLSASWGIIIWLTNRTPVPERLKEIQYKIANIDLNKEQLIGLQVEINKILGLNEPVFTRDSTEEDPSEEDANSLISEDEYGWYRRIDVDPQKQTYSFYSHTPDYDGIYNSKHEYRFENGMMMARLIENSSENYGDPIFDVKDNVVLESEIRQRYAEQKFHIEDVEVKLKDLKSAVVWSEYKAYEIRYFVMSKHPEVFPSNDFKRIARQDLERLRTGASHVLTKARELKAVVKESKSGFGIRLPDNCDPETKKALNESFTDEEFKQANITSNELNCFKDYETTLLRWLGERPFTKFWTSLLSKAKKLTNLHSSVHPVEKELIGIEVKYSPKTGQPLKSKFS